MTYLSLVIAFVILATLLLIIFTRSNIGLKYKLLLVPITIWYGMVLYYTPLNILGWSVPIEPPDNSIVVGAWVNEPSIKSTGGIHLWCIPIKEQNDDGKISLSPKKFSEYLALEPRSFKIPYDRERHKKLLEAQKQQKEQKGVIFYTKDKNKKGGERSNKQSNKETYKDDSGFKVLTPQDLFLKED